MNSNFKDLITLLKTAQVRFLVVGGYAVMLYGEPRYTKDLDVLIGMAEADLDGFTRAFAEFGFPISEEAATELRQPNKMISVGNPPVRIDVMNEIAGVDFDRAWERRNIVMVEGVEVPFISLVDLIAAKKASGRGQDLLDLEALQKALRQRPD